MNDRLPPHSLPSEQALLGCILLDSKVALPVAVIGLHGDEFFDLRHKAVYECMLHLAEEGAPITPLTVGEELKGRKEQFEGGWFPFLSSLPEAASTAHEAQHFVGIVSEKAALRRLISVCTELVSEAFDPATNVEALLSKAEQKILTVRRMRRPESESIKTLVNQALDLIETLHRNQGALGGMSTGFIDLDRAHDGLHSDELVVIGGFPGSGKTSFAVNIAEHLSVDLHIPIGVFSFEMSPLQLTLRMLSSRARINLRRLREGFLEERDMPKIAESCRSVALSPIYLQKSSGMTIQQLRSRARQMKAEFGIKFWLIDYTQLVAESGDKSANREREVANISRNLKEMAGEFGDPVIALSQLNDDGKLRESRAIGQDADSVWKLEVQKEQGNNPDSISVSLHIEKQRNGPSPMTVPLTFLKCFTRFESAAKISKEDYPSKMPYKS